MVKKKQNRCYMVKDLNCCKKIYDNEAIRWESQIKTLCRDFCIPNDKINEIISATKAKYLNRERNDLMYNFAHQKMMEVLYS